MAITKTSEVGKSEVVGTWNIQVAMDTVIKEDGKEISRSRHRHVLQPFASDYKVKEQDGQTVPDLDKDGKKQWTYTDTDISKEDAKVQAICNAVWTDDVKDEYKTFTENSEL